VDRTLFLGLFLVMAMLQGLQQDSGTIIAIGSAQSLCYDANMMVLQGIDNESTKSVMKGRQWNRSDFFNVIPGDGDLFFCG
jgi:hypothetical protein